MLYNLATISMNNITKLCKCCCPPSGESSLGTATALLLGLVVGSRVGVASLAVLVFRLLVQAGPDGLAAGALADAVGVSPSAMSFHLAQLSHAGLIAQRREGRSIIYSANYAAMNAVPTMAPSE